ncbi:pathogenesis-related protein PR-1 type-like [Magnolia sinica]|uniref:pathogenesis-related protein PR-1 type-like n=1 Tax=Magnolia sinica TaxID=86752 RepID=UPI0026590BEF|nr:pathogenesis-related protein PR-1 type-like [Magnolia sinica]
MASSSHALAFMCVMALILAHLSMAQNSPQDFLRFHNVVRAQVGVGPMSWDNAVATYARNYANQRISDCNLVHSGGPYGENIFWGYGREYTAADAVTSWASERQNYNYDTNTCASGKVCGHYTQVVWRNSVRLGCARVKCNNGAFFITCNYSPPGNYAGQRPYDILIKPHVA